MSAAGNSPPASSSATLLPMTLIVGIAARDAALLVGDVKGALPSGQEFTDVQKLYKCGKRVAVGTAGKGDIARAVLEGAGFIDNDDDISPYERAKQVGAAFRAC